MITEKTASEEGSVIDIKLLGNNNDVRNTLSFWKFTSSTLRKLSIDIRKKTNIAVIKKK